MARACFSAAHIGAHVITHVCPPQNICMQFACKLEKV